VRTTLENNVPYAGYVTLNGNKTEDYVSSPVTCILHFFTVNVSYKPSRRRNPEKSNLENKGYGNGSPFSHPTIRKLPVQKGTNTVGEARWCTI
jgi:hypothetical protein